MNPKPMPIILTVCSVCGEPWKHHTDRVRQRAWDAHYESDDYEPFTFEPPRDPDELVLLTDCISALRVRNQGPMGPVGPMGNTGRDGRDLR